MPRILLLLVLAVTVCSCTISREHDPRIVGYWQESPISPWVYHFRADGKGGQVDRKDIKTEKEPKTFTWWVEGEHLFIEDSEDEAAREGFYSFGRSGSLRVSPSAFGKSDVVLRKIDPNNPKSRRTTREPTENDPLR